jgi:excisionase family DNA binding protein
LWTPRWQPTPREWKEMMALQQRFKKIPATKDEKRYLTPKQSAVYTGLSKDKIYEMIRDRKIPYSIQPTSTGSGNRPRYLIDRTDWDGFFQRRKIAAIERRSAVERRGFERREHRKW